MDFPFDAESTIERGGTVDGSTAFKMMHVLLIGPLSNVSKG